VAGLVAKRRELAVANSRWRGSPSYKFEKPGVTGEHHSEEPAVTGYRKTRGGGEHLRRNCYRGAAMLRAAWTWIASHVRSLSNIINNIINKILKNIIHSIINNIIGKMLNRFQ
jgi:hypothetical protein